MTELVNQTSATQTPSAKVVQGELKLLGGLNEKLFNLLAAIDTTGSINQAAKTVGLTYKGAWEMIGRANNLSPKLLVITAVGGRQGGGTRLTPAGVAFLNLFKAIQREHSQFLQKLNQRLSADTDIIFLLKKLVMRASARNQFSGKVTELNIGSTYVTVVTVLKGGQYIVANITHASANALALSQGDDVIALVKAPQVVLVSDFGGYRLSTRNQLQGHVSYIQKGDINAEVIIEIKGGDSIAATVSNPSLELLALAIGNPVTAVFKSGDVILGKLP